MPRDSSGNYTLPTGNPVVPGTIIESAWANSTASDIAIQLNNLITRDGLLGPTAPILFPNGTVGLPSIAFALSPSTGLYRYTPNNIGLSIAGVQRQAWDATGSGISGNFGVTGTLGVTGDVTLAGNINIAGNASFAGHMLLMDGTLAAPAYTFTSDVSTGMYCPAAAQLGFSVTGIPILTATVSALSSTVNSDSQAGFFATNNSGGTHSAALFKAINNSGKNIQIAAIGSANLDYPAASSTGMLYSDTSQGLMLIAQAASSYIRFASNGFAEQMRLNSIGLGIGVAATITGIKLDVNGTIRGIGGAGASGSGYGIRLLDSTGFSGGSLTVPEGASTGLSISGDGGPLKFFAGGSQRVTFETTGNVSIGSGNPGYALFVGNGNFNVGSPYPGAGNTPIQKYMVFSAIQSIGSEVAQAGLSVIYNRLSDTDYGSNLLFLTANDNVAIERMRIDNSGNIGIGLTPNVNGVSIQRNGVAVLKLKGVSSGAAATLALVGDTTNANGVQIAWYDDSSGEAARYALGMNVGAIGTTDWGLYSYVRSRNELTMSGGRLLLGGAAAVPSLGNGAINIRNDTDSGGDWNNFIHIQNLGGGSGDTNTYTAGGIAFSSFRDIAFPSVIASIWVERGSQVGGLASSGQIIFATAQTGGTGPTSPLEKMRIPYGNFPCSISDTSGNRFAIAIDTGSTVAAIPIGAIVFGQATLPGGSAALTGLGTFACSGSNPITWGGYTGGSSTSITFGTWRNIGASTAGGVGLWMRVG